MKDINLLPPELKPNSVALKYSKRLNKIAINFFLLFFVGLSIAGIALVALTFRFNSLNENQIALEANLKALQGTEQKLILVKDRLTKISQVLNIKSGTAGINALDAINNNLPEGVVISGAEITSGLLTLGVVTDKSQNLSAFFNMVSDLNFQNVNLTSFSYDSKLGYRIEITVAS